MGDYNLRRIKDGVITAGDIRSLVRDYQSRHKLKEDGLIGPETLIHLRGSARVGDIGNPSKHGKEDPEWVRANIVECHDRGDRPRMPGVPAKWWLKVHRLVEPRLRAGLQAALEACPDYQIQRIGGYVFRHQRHDPSRPLSTHAYGIAVDVDAYKNGARHLGSVQIEPWSAQWLKIWPKGLPREWVEAMERHGWVWGGRWTGFVDPMHFQYTGEH